MRRSWSLCWVHSVADCVKVGGLCRLGPFKPSPVLMVIVSVMLAIALRLHLGNWPDSCAAVALGCLIQPFISAQCTVVSAVPQSMRKRRRLLL